MGDKAGLGRGHGGQQRVAWEPACAPASCFGCKQTRGQSAQGHPGGWREADCRLRCWVGLRDRASSGGGAPWSTFTYRHTIVLCIHGWMLQWAWNNIFLCCVMPTWLHLIREVWWVCKHHQTADSHISPFVVETKLYDVGNESDETQIMTSKTWVWTWMVNVWYLTQVCDSAHDQEFTQPDFLWLLSRIVMDVIFHN